MLTTLFLEVTSQSCEYLLELGINNNKDQNFTVGPNPTNRQLFISHTDIQQQINIYDLRGQLLQSEQTPNARSFSIDVSNLHCGVYLVQLIDEIGVASSRLVVLEL